MARQRLAREAGGDRKTSEPKGEPIFPMWWWWGGRTNFPSVSYLRRIQPSQESHEQEVEDAGGRLHADPGAAGRLLSSASPRLSFIQSLRGPRSSVTLSARPPATARMLGAAAAAAVAVAARGTLIHSAGILLRAGREGGRGRQVQAGRGGQGKARWSRRAPPPPPLPPASPPTPKK